MDLEKLLGREKIEIDLTGIASFLTDKRILITGAGGSIGSELVKKVANFKPEKLILLDNNENEIYYLEIELNGKANVFPVIADIKDAEKIDQVFSFYKPEVVFHAAAHKHIPLMELFPEEAVKNNIFGTKNVLQSAKKFGVKKFVFISSDKAVKPSSIMGATKYIGEKIVQSVKELNAVSVRFGNVVESNGSVIPLFKKQIDNEPVTITHPAMERYFMTLHEAAELILQAAAIGKDNEIFVLDMGKPIKIIDIAKRLIEESEKQIEIKIIGKRPGEKISEELLLDNEKATKHRRIFIVNGNGTIKNLEEEIKTLCDFAKKADKEAIRKKLKEIVPNNSI
jgi:FlaA1/EpsC-like NDP-sugar epimerase